MAPIALAAAHLKRVQRDLTERILRLVSQQGLESSARALGFWSGGRATFDDAERPVFVDYAIYEYRSDGTSAVDLYVQRSDLTLHERNVLEAMRRARLAVIQIEDVVEGVGVRGIDALTQQRWLVAEPNLSLSASPGVTLATRLLTFGDFALTTGAELHFDAEISATVIQMALSARDGAE